MERRARGRRAEAGSALVASLVAVVIIAAAVTAGARFLVYTSQTSERIFESKDQAYGVARAGIIDALSWFRRQTAQPVTAFAPARNLAAVPPVNETDNTAVGLVRNYPITPSIWARYEVRLPNAADPDNTMQDVTTARGLPGAGPGTVWQIVTHGYIFRRNYKNPADPTNAWNEAVEWDPVLHRPTGNPTDGTNELVAHVRLATEVRRLTIIPPGSAALCSRQGSTLVLGNRSRVVGGDQAGIVYSQGTGAPTLAGALSGIPSQAAVAGYADDWTDVFGMPLQDLLAMPDVKVRAVDDLPNPLPDFTLTFYTGNVVFDVTHPLRSSAAVLIVDGDLTIAPNSNSFFNGFIYVRGNYVQGAPSSIRGTLAVRGSVNVSGLGDYSEVWSDRPLMTELMRRMGQYRLSQAIRLVGVQGVN